MQKTNKPVFNLTRCYISAVWYPQAGGCVCGGNKDSCLFSDRCPGEGRGLEDTHSPPHTPPCTGPWWQRVPLAEERSSWGDRRTRSLKTPDLWDTPGLQTEEKMGENMVQPIFSVCAQMWTTLPLFPVMNKKIFRPHSLSVLHMMMMLCWAHSRA